MHYANDPRYMGWRNFFDPRNRSYFGLRFAYETIPNELVPFDYDAFEAYPGQAEAVVTNLLTGQAEYRPVPRRDDKFLLLQATCAMPVLFQPIRLDGGIPYLDGGCADAIPWQQALDVGCDRVVVVLTRERSYRKEPERLMPLFRRVYRKYPAFLEDLRTRAERYNRVPGGAVRPGAGGEGAGDRAGGHPGLLPDGAGPAKDPGPVAGRLLCRPPGRRSGPGLLDGEPDRAES